MMTEPDFQIVAPHSAAWPRNSEGDIAVFPNGRWLLAWSAFYGGARDHSPAHIMGRWSHDKGETWGDPVMLLENDGGVQRHIGQRRGLPRRHRWLRSQPDGRRELPLCVALLPLVGGRGRELDSPRADGRHEDPVRLPVQRAPHGACQRTPRAAVPAEHETPPRRGRGKASSTRRIPTTRGGRGSCPIPWRLGERPQTG